MTFADKAGEYCRLHNIPMLTSMAIAEFAIWLDQPSEPVDPASLTTIEEFEAAIMPIIDRFGETTLEATKQMAHDLVPIVKALEASLIDKVYKDALLVKFSKRMDDLSTSIDGLDLI